MRKSANRCRLSTGIGLLLLTCLPAAPAGGTTNIAALVRRLGAGSYQERQAARNALREIGAPATAALERAAESGDPEVALSARDLLWYIRHGVRTAWPADLRRRARVYDTLSAAEQNAFLDRLVAGVGREAVPFLLKLLEEGTAAEAETAAAHVQVLAREYDLWEDLTRRLKEPANPYEARVLAFACQAVGSLSNIVAVLANRHLEENLRSPLTGAAVARLREDIEHGRNEAVVAATEQLAAVAPDEARFPYLGAVAALELGRRETARKLQTAALGLSPAAESPHYVAGEMLMDMGRFAWAEQEWLAILEIPPAGDVYDMNAYLRLAAIFARRHQHDRAADAYQAVLDLYAAARRAGGSGYGIVGADEDGLAKRVARQRRLAAGECKAGGVAAPEDAGTNIEIDLDMLEQKGRTSSEPTVIRLQIQVGD